MDESEVRRLTLEHFVNLEEIKACGLVFSEEPKAAGWTSLFTLREEIYPHPLREFWESSHEVYGRFVVSIVGNVHGNRRHFDSKDLEGTT